MPPRKRRTKAEMERARRRSETSRRHHLKVAHNMTLEQYDKILWRQDGTCQICQRAKGLGRKLSVDHDHKIAREQCEHEHDKSCPRCWRGLLCSRCNAMLGHLRDDPEAFERAASYLQWPPAQICPDTQWCELHKIMGVHSGAI